MLAISGPDGMTQSLLEVGVSMDIPPSVMIVLASICMLPIAFVVTLGEMNALSFFLSSGQRLTTRSLLFLAAVAVPTMAVFVWLEHAAIPMMIFASISAVVAFLVDLPILAWHHGQKARPELPAGARQWIPIVSPLLLVALGLILPAATRAALPETVEDEMAWQAILIAYLILLASIAGLVALVRWAEFAFEAKRSSGPSPEVDSPSLPG